MKFFTNKSIWSKIIIVLIFVLVFEFIVAKPTLADDYVAEGIEFGGKLLSPILSLIVTIGDGIIGVAHSAIMGVSEPLLQADLGSTLLEIRGDILVAVVTAAVMVGAFILGAGVLGTLLAGVVVGSYMGAMVSNATSDKVSGAVTSYSEKAIPETLYLPAYSISPEEIFKGRVLLFNVDFFGKPTEIKTATKTDADGNTVVAFYYYEDSNGDDLDTNGDGTTDVKGYKTSKQDMGAQLSSTISQWYVSIRNIALVAMMIVLLYIGIRMLLSTISSDKAKYRQMLQDWVMGLLLLFLMHYIMAFSVTLVQKLTDIVSSSIDNKAYFAVIPMSEDSSKADKFKDFIDEAGLQDYYIDDNKNQTNRDSATAVIYPTNLMGALRIDVQLTTYGAEYVGKAICFLVLVLMTLFFIFTYLRRVLYMAFLTIIAPMVAVTYPIDKLNDGSAQGFTKWFREYIFNLLIQPMHLLLYYILITSAFDLAGENVIYSIVAIGFMIPAEKLLRSLFGFEKASTPGAFSGVAGGALAMAGINKLSHLGHGRGSSSGGGSGEAVGSGSGSSNKPRINGNVDKQANMMAIAGVSGSDSDENENQNDNDNSNSQNSSLQKNREEQLQMLKDDLDAEGLSPGDREYEQMAKERGFTSEDLKKFEESQQPKEDKTIEIEQKEESPKEEKKDSKWERRKRELMRTAQARGAVSLDRGKRTLKNTVKAVPRTALKVAGGAVAGAAGVAAGVATGDPSNVLSYGGTAAAAGAAAAGTLSGIGRMSTEDQKVWNQVYNAPEYEDLERANYRKKFIKEHKDQLGRNFTKEQVKEMTKDGGVVEKYLDNGIDDIEDIIAGEKMRESGKVKSVDEAITVTSFAREVKDNYKGPNREKWEKATAKRYQEKAKLSEEQAKKVAKTSMDMAEQFNKAKKNVHK